MKTQSSPLLRAYRYLIVAIAVFAAFLFGLAIHMGVQDGSGPATVAIVLGIVAEAMSAPLKNPPFSCLVAVTAIAVIAIIAVL